VTAVFTSIDKHQVNLSLTDAKMATAIDRLTGLMKPMVLALNRLNHYGVGSIADVSIPQIVLLGDQSTGKSSLVEALAEIRVPRGAGTCTRVPLEINLVSHPGPWTAEVKLHKKWEYAPSASKAEDNGEFPGWSAVPASLVPFCNVSNRQELEHAIRLAQLANLNPSSDPMKYVGMTPNVAHKESIIAQTEFSPNSVIVEIRGEGVPNLSFVDLPGIISQADAGYHLVTLIRNLAKNHMKGPNTLILLVISMESDMMNSPASGLVNEVRATDRCVGVLTKPDRRDDSVQQWQEVICGQKFQLEHGYFVTKQPATGKLDISYDEARAEEMAFFDDVSWKSQFPNETRRQGTRNLQAALSKQLLTISTKSIPQIAIKLEEKLQLIEQRLRHLPEPTKAPRYEIEKIVADFHRIAADQFRRSRYDGEISDVRRKWKDAAERFRDEIMEQLRPKFTFTADLEQPSKKRKRIDAESIAYRASPSAAVKRDADIIDLDDSSNSGPDSASQPDTPATPVKTTRRKGKIRNCEI
jgi:GTPase SAR1 family protein